ncbi:MAG: hypothetical protein HS127_18770 [Planctomycetia bacterium]|nr:hypothetical protein [Planctomycetia bacterium]
MQECKINYFVGSPEKWRTNIPTFGAVEYKIFTTASICGLRQQPSDGI